MDRSANNLGKGERLIVAPPTVLQILYLYNELNFFKVAQRSHTHTSLDLMLKNWNNNNSHLSATPVRVDNVLSCEKLWFVLFFSYLRGLSQRTMGEETRANMLRLSTRQVASLKWVLSWPKSHRTRRKKGEEDFLFALRTARLHLLLRLEPVWWWENDAHNLQCRTCPGQMTGSNQLGTKSNSYKVSGLHRHRPFNKSYHLVMSQMKWWIDCYFRLKVVYVRIFKTKVLRMSYFSWHDT